MNYYHHHLGDYDGHTAHLSWLEDCAYRRLICLYYRTEKPLPAELAKLQRLVRAATAPERTAVETVLDEFFVLESDGYHNARCDREVAKYAAKAERNREVGKRGGRPKQTGTHSEPRNNPDGFETEPTENPSQEPEAKNQERLESLNGKGKVSLRAQEAGSINYRDPENRKARWEQKMFDFVNRIKTPEEASKLIVAYVNREPDAIAEFDKLDKERKSRQSNVA